MSAMSASNIMSAELVSLNLGTAQPLELGGRTVLSGIFKAPVGGPRWLGTEGLAGDEQADRRYHGGPDKAVNIYPGEHYAHWSSVLGGPLTPGAFGENFTTRGLVESEVAIGDVLRVGRSVLVQITQPRQPCGKLAARHGMTILPKLVEETGRTGFYVRCLEPGDVESGDKIMFEERPSVRVTVREANDIMRCRKVDREGVERLLAVEALSAAWRETLESIG